MNCSATDIIFDSWDTGSSDNVWETRQQTEKLFRKFVTEGLQIEDNNSKNWPIFTGLFSIQFTTATNATSTAR